MSKNLICYFFFFNDPIRTDVNTTTATVDLAVNANGRYINAIINTNTERVGTFSRDFSIDAGFINPKKSKHPAAISQNLVGIKKYAAG